MRKRIALIIIGVAGLVLGLIYVYFKQTSQPITKPEVTDAMPPTEQFVVTHLMDTYGLIRTDFTHNPLGNEALAESHGLWMTYLSLVDDPEGFDLAVDVLTDHFLSRDNLVMWEIQGETVAQTNALIDDLRIIDALYTVGDRDGMDHYLTLANKLSTSVLTYNRLDDQLIDFYDRQYKQKAETLTLSYLNPAPFKNMVEHGVMTKEAFNDLTMFMKAIPQDDVFMPFSYDVSEAVFKYNETVNLIDQLYLAYYLTGFGVETEAFASWFKATFQVNDHLYGRYDSKTLMPAVDYESVAVYALGILYSLARGDDDLAVSLYDVMIQHRTSEDHTPYYGGYVYADSTHAFDNLLALIAERKLLDDELIQSTK